MNARKKLNQANVNGALLLALVVGWMFQSLSAFIIAAIFFVVTAMYTHDIRPSGNYDSTSLNNPPRPPPSRRRSKSRRE